MKLPRFANIAVAALLVGGIAALLVLGFLEGRKERAIEMERERPIKTPSRISLEEGESVITLDSATQAKSGIAVEPLTPVSTRQERHAYGTVLQAQELIDLSKAYADAKAQTEKAEAALDASRQEYERLKRLNADNKNISDKLLQSAASTWRSDEALLASSRETLRAVEHTATQRWGRIIARWIIEGSTSYQRIAGLQDILILVTLPAGKPIDHVAERVQVRSVTDTVAFADFVSPSPRTDARVQGMSYLYIVRDSPAGLILGMNVTAILPVGAKRSGVMIPGPAVIWWQGKAWVYMQKDLTRFIRHEISADHPFKDGWFVSKEFTAKDRVVVRGAQTLLSEELRSQIQVVGEEK